MWKTSALRSPLAWAAVAAAVAVGIVMTFSYLGAFLDPVGNARDLPVTLVDEDAGSAVGGQRLELGQELAGVLTSAGSPLGDAIEWTVLPTRGDALERIAADEAFAAVVIPRDYSRRLAAVAAPSAGLPVATRVEVLTNPAAGSLARAASEELVTSAVMGVSMKIAGQLARAGGAQSTPAEVAHRVDDSVQVRASEATEIGEKSARGLAPFYFALMLALTGFIGTVMISIAVEHLNGHVAVDLFALRLHRPKSQLSRTALWGTKLVLVSALSVLGGTVLTAFAIEILGMTATNPIELGLFAVLGVAAAALVALAFLTAFGLAGSLLGVIFITILGVPTSGGPYPIQMLPGFFRFLAEWLPLRYLTDGARSLVFFEGSLEAGLGTAIWVLAAYALGAALAGGLVAVAIDRVQLRHGLVRARAVATGPKGTVDDV